MPVPESPPRGRRPARVLAAVTAVYWVTLVWATHHPQPQRFLGPKPPSDKLLHLVAYGLLGALVALTLVAARRLTPRGGLAVAAALAAFAALDEATQPLPWFRRSADPFDWLCDVAGGTAGIGAVALLAAAARRVSSSASGRGSRPGSPT